MSAPATAACQCCISCVASVVWFSLLGFVPGGLPACWAATAAGKMSPFFDTSPNCHRMHACRGLPLDYTAPLGALFHKLTLIPEPGAAAASAAPATPAAAKRGKTPRTARGRAALAATQGAAGAAAGSSPARGAVESEPELWREEQDQEQLAPVRRTSRRRTLTDKD